MGFFGTTSETIGTSNLVCTPFHRQMNFGDEVNQTVPHMRQGLNAWTE